MRLKFCLTAFLLLLTCVGSHAANGDVTLTRGGSNNRACTLRNDLVSVYIAANGEITSFLLYKDKDGNYDKSVQLTTDKGYFSVANSSGAVGLSISAFYEKVNTSDMVEVQYVTSQTGGIEWVVGYIMRRGVAGIYHYVQANGKVDGANFSEARMGFRGDPTLFNYAYVNDEVQEALPTPSEMSSATVVTDATYQIAADRPIYTKYNYAAFQKDDAVHGMMGDHVGLWMISASEEWLNGGVMRQDLTVHATETTPIVLRHFQGNHFGGVSTYLNNGQSKYYGPHLIYANYSASDDVATAHNAMIADAKAQAATEQDAWPYSWLRDDNIKKRGTVTGQMTMTADDATYFGTTRYQVILAQPGTKPMLQGDGYQFWAETDAEGNFTINNVRAGSYSLYAYALNGTATGYYERADVTVTDGNTTALGAMNWQPDADRYDEVLWHIGEADHLAAGYNMSGHRRQYGLWNDVPAALTFTVGTSSETTDWYYAQAHHGTWTIKYQLDELPTYPLRLTIATAGAANAKLTVRSNETTSTSGIGVFRPTHDGSVSRCATLAGRDSLVVFDIPVSQLKVGENSLYLNVWGLGTDNLGNSLGGILYDMIKLEKKNSTVQVISEETALGFNNETTDNSSGLSAITNYQNTGFYLRGGDNKIPLRVPGKDTRSFTFSDGTQYSSQNFVTLQGQTKNDYTSLPAANVGATESNRLNIGFQTIVPGTVYVAFQSQNSPAEGSKLRLILNGTVVKESSLPTAAGKTARLDVMEYTASEAGTFFIDSWSSAANVFYVKFVPTEDPQTPLATSSHWNFRQYDVNDIVLQGADAGATLDYSGLCLHVNGNHTVQAKTSTVSETKDIAGISYRGTVPSLFFNGGTGAVASGYPASSERHYVDAFGIDASAAGTFYALVQAPDAVRSLTFNVNGSDGASDNLTNQEVKVVSCHVSDAAPIMLKSNGSFYLIAAAFVPDMESQVSLQVSVSSAGCATFSSPYHMTLPDGLKAYRVSAVSETEVTLESIAAIPACTGVVLRGEEGNYTLTSTSSASAVGTNYMVANMADYSLKESAGNYYHYTLATGPVFKRSNGTGDLAAGMAFLRTTVQASSAPAMLEMKFSDDVTGVQYLSADDAFRQEMFFDLQGRRVTQPAKGLYIKNGKKVLIIKN